MFTNKMHPCQGGTASDRMDPVLLAVAEALLAVEHACVDQARPNPHSPPHTHLVLSGHAASLTPY